ncbi:H+/gluconate symporter-like permease [Peribacillus sp. B2I2]
MFRMLQMLFRQGYLIIGIPAAHFSWSCFWFLHISLENRSSPSWSSVVVSFFTLGYARGINKVALNQFMSACLAPPASIILIIGAGGAFKNVLNTGGVGEAVASLTTFFDISLILFGCVAAMIRVATGSAIVAMTTAVGIVLPIIFCTRC